MSTKIITISAAGSVPTESTGADYNKGAPLNVTEFDQNLINLRAAIDRRALSAAPTFTGVVTLSDTTESTSTSTGGLILAGGLGLAKKLTGVNAAFSGAVSAAVLTASDYVTTGGNLVFIGTGGGIYNSTVTSGFTYLVADGSAYAGIYAYGTTHATKASLLELKAGNGIIATLSSTGLSVTGTLSISALPTSDPHVAGALFRSTNTVMVSTG